MGRLDDAPLQPLSRSVPSAFTVRTSSFGPAGFSGHALAPAAGVVPAGRHSRITSSRSTRGATAARATSGRWSLPGRRTCPPRRTFTGTSTSTKAPHAGPAGGEPGGGGGGGGGVPLVGASGGRRGGGASPCFTHT